MVQHRSKPHNALMFHLNTGWHSLCVLIGELMGTRCSQHFNNLKV